MSDERVGERLRSRVAERAGGFCEYCRSPRRYSVAPFSVEHIHPRIRGGHHGLDNLAFACLGCNGHKHAKTEAVDPVTGKPAPLFHPRRQKWKDHFGWSKDYTLVLGQSPTGRATVDALHLNREGHVNLRRLLYAAGVHPPPD
ncbi:MAG: HNH endonuclease [bacterium]|nr:HNH endonuclease [bacterium]